MSGPVWDPEDSYRPAFLWGSNLAINHVPAYWVWLYGAEAAIILTRIHGAGYYMARPDSPGWYGESAEELADATGVTPPQARRAVEDLLDAEAIEERQGKHGIEYRVAPDVRTPPLGGEAAGA